MKKIALLIISTLLFGDVGTVSKVVDGDTVYFGKVKCRLAYIDTPESKFNKKAKADAKRCPGITLDTMIKEGKKATKFTKKHLIKGRSYKYDVIDTDRYGREVCVIYLPNKRIFNEFIVEEGYASPFWKYIPKELKKTYQQKSKYSKNKVIECLSK